MQKLLENSLQVLLAMEQDPSVLARCGLTPACLPALVDHNPVIAVEVISNPAGVVLVQADLQYPDAWLPQPTDVNISPSMICHQIGQGHLAVLPQLVMAALGTGHLLLNAVQTACILSLAPRQTPLAACVDLDMRQLSQIQGPGAQRPHRGRMQVLLRASKQRKVASCGPDHGLLHL